MNSGSDGPAPTADYGLDAPGVVRNLLLVGVSGFLLWATSALRFWPGRVAVGPIGGVRLIFPVREMGLQLGIAFTAVGLWMIWTSKVGKVRRRERLLDRIPWTGRERVLDIGCGRGLMLIGAARRLTTGRAFGIDRWQAEDLSGNRPDATVENARREHVLRHSQRVRPIRTWPGHR